MTKSSGPAVSGLEPFDLPAAPAAAPAWAGWEVSGLATPAAVSIGLACCGDVCGCWGCPPPTVLVGVRTETGALLLPAVATVAARGARTFVGTVTVALPPEDGCAAVTGGPAGSSGWLLMNGWLKNTSKLSLSLASRLSSPSRRSARSLEMLEGSLPSRKI